MTEITRILYSWIAIALPFIVMGIWGVVRAQIGTSDVAWHSDRTLRLPMAIGSALIAGALLFAAAVLSPSIQRLGITQYLIWSGLSFVVIAEWLILSVVGRLQIAVGVSLLWAIAILTRQGFFA